MRASAAHICPSPRDLAELGGEKKLPAELRRKLQKLRYLDFQGHDRHDWLSLDLSDDELLDELRRAPKTELYLGRYTEADVMEILVRHGIIRKLNQLGFRDVQVEVRTDEVLTHRLYVYYDKKDYDHILIELRLREGVFRPREQFIPELLLGPMPMIMVDWLMLQNPRREFDPERPALPEQRYPGLGLLNTLIPIIEEAARETGRSGILDTPEHFHGALFYSRFYRFFNPEMEGRFLAMQRDLAGPPLHTVSQCIYHDCLKNTATGQYEKWAPGEQILPVSQELKRYFHHPKYMDIRDAAYQNNSYDLDLDKCAEKARREEGAKDGPGVSKEA
jgi:hypothetical protein